MLKENARGNKYWRCLISGIFKLLDDFESKYGNVAMSKDEYLKIKQKFKEEK